MSGLKSIIKYKFFSYYLQISIAWLHAFTLIKFAIITIIIVVFERRPCIFGLAFSLLPECDLILIKLLCTHTTCKTDVNGRSLSIDVTYRIPTCIHTLLGNTSWPTMSITSNSFLYLTSTWLENRIHTSKLNSKILLIFMYEIQSYDCRQYFEDFK